MIHCGLGRRFSSPQCFRGSHAAALYNMPFTNPVQAVKVAGMVIISLALVLRSARLFVGPDLQTAVGAAVLAACIVRFGYGNTLLVVTLLATAVLSVLLHDMPTDNAGHRAGGHGYGGPQPQENTLEALRDLIRRDNAKDCGPLQKLAYVECDVHETKDGVLVVFHDDTLKRAIPDADGLNAAPLAALREVGLSLNTARIHQMTAAQLQGFHLGGINGSHIPTLQDYLRVCTEEGLRRSIAVEVKTLQTDVGRQQLLDLMRGYAADNSGRLEQSWPQLKYNLFGWAAVIAFPQTWAQNFGEFKSDGWRFWARKFGDAGMPVKSCVFHWLLLTYGA